MPRGAEGRRKGEGGYGAAHHHQHHQTCYVTDSQQLNCGHGAPLRREGPRQRVFVKAPGGRRGERRPECQHMTGYPLRHVHISILLLLAVSRGHFHCSKSTYTYGRSSSRAHISLAGWTSNTPVVQVAKAIKCSTMSRWRKAAQAPRCRGKEKGRKGMMRGGTSLSTSSKLLYDVDSQLLNCGHGAPLRREGPRQRVLEQVPGGAARRPPATRKAKSNRTTGQQHGHHEQVGGITIIDDGSHLPLQQAHMVLAVALAEAETSIIS